MACATCSAAWLETPLLLDSCALWDICFMANISLASSSPKENCDYLCWQTILCSTKWTTFQEYFFFSLNWYEILWSKKATGVNKSAELQVGLNSTYYSIHHLLKRTAFHIAINRGKILYFLSQEDTIIVFSQFSVFPIHFVQVRWSKVQKE